MNRTTRESTFWRAMTYWLLCFAVFFLAYAVYLTILARPLVPQADALRYIDYILNLNVHGIFGLGFGDPSTIPAHGRANAPIYMALVAGISSVDAGLQESLKCVFQNSSSPAACPSNLNSLYWLNAALGAATITVGMAISLRISRNEVVAWMAGGIMLVCLIEMEDGLRIAPENAMLLPFFVMCWATLRATASKSLAACMLIGAAIAATTLVRPSYLYLIYGYGFAFVLTALVLRDRHWLKMAVAMAAGFAVAVAPWALRNYWHFDDLALSGGQYAELIIAQRLAYHVLDWSQIAVAFVFWLPDFGDDLARAFGSSETLDLLGTGPSSIFANAISGTYNSAVTKLGGPDGVLRHLIVTYVLMEPVKFVALTAAFAWRGLFVAKLIGLVGAICTAVSIWHTLRQRDWSLVVLLAPMAFMVLFHAAISISIERYNTFLILPYGLSIAWVLHESVGKIRALGSARGWWHRKTDA